MARDVLRFLGFRRQCIESSRQIRLLPPEERDFLGTADRRRGVSLGTALAGPAEAAHAYQHHERAEQIGEPGKHATSPFTRRKTQGSSLAATALYYDNV